MELKSFQEIKAYFQGKRDGAKLYAWWKDGTQYVGSGVRTLPQALEELTILENQTLIAFSEGTTIYTN